MTAVQAAARTEALASRLVSLEGGTVFDGRGGDPRHARVEIAGNRFTAVTPAGRRRRDAQAIDVSGLFVLPGLIDAHAHLGLLGITAPAPRPAALVAALVFRNCAQALEAGFTTVRDVGGIDAGVATAVANGLISGPRILPSGPVLVQVGGHGDRASPFGTTVSDLAVPGLVHRALVCDGVDAARRAAREVLRRGAAQIKVAIGGGVASLYDRMEDTQFSHDELAAIVGEAGARGTYVTAHAWHPRAIRHGLAAGIACFEHGGLLDEETAYTMASGGAALVATISVLAAISERGDRWGLTREMQARAAPLRARAAEALRIARTAGVLIGSGSDLLGEDQRARGGEIVAHAAVEGAQQAIITATADNARILRMDDLIGTIEQGKLADTIAVDGDPFTHPELLEDPHRVVLVVHNGVVLKDAQGRASRRLVLASDLPGRMAT